MILICTSPYRNRGVVYRVGDMITIPDEEGRALLADSPGSFRVDSVADQVTPEPAPPMDGEAPRNTAITRAPRRKG